MTPDDAARAAQAKFAAWMKSACRQLSVRNAVMRERYIGNEERLTDPVAQYQTALLLSDIRAQWRAEKRGMGL